jgi:hypothetical protein
VVLLRHPKDGVEGIRLNPAVRNSQNDEVANLVKLFDLVNADGYPLTVPAEEWVQYYELIRRLGLFSRPFLTLIKGLKIKNSSPSDYDVIRDQMKSFLGFAAVLDRIYSGLNEATWALAAGFASKILSLCTGLSEIC